LNVPLWSDVELTVTVAAEPIHGEVADGEVKLVISGLLATVNDEVLPVDTLLVQDEFFTAVIVNSVGPAAVRVDDGIVNVPLPELIANAAVLFDTVLTPLKL
jgi:hypothetical protein